jgi:RNA recognition motif-containing protein
MQTKKLYIANLNHSVTQDELIQLFSNYGEVQQVRLIMVEGRGFAIVEMSKQLEATAAKETLNNSDFKGRPLRFHETYLPRIAE